MQPRSRRASETAAEGEPGDTKARRDEESPRITKATIRVTGVSPVQGAVERATIKFLNSNAQRTAETHRDTSCSFVLPRLFVPSCLRVLSRRPSRRRRRATRLLSAHRIESDVGSGTTVTPS